MKRANRIWITIICAITCLLGAGHWFHTAPVYAQQSTEDYYDGTFYISASVDVDDSDNLYVDSYMEVDFDEDEDIDATEVDGTADEDGAAIAEDYADGDDDDPAEFELASDAPVAAGHEYGMESDGYACYDDGEGDCDWEYVGSAYASVTIPPATPPDPCAVTSNSEAGYSSLAAAGAAGGSGTMAVSFSGSAYTSMSASATYGPYSTPSSIASNIAALITKNYFQYGLTARAFGPNIVYAGLSTIGAVSNLITGNGGTTASFTTNTSSQAATAAQAACESAGGDSTPMITGIVPDDWASGQTTSNVTFSGVNFGSNAPTLTFSPSSGIGYSLSSYSDTQIVANVSVASGTPTEDVAVTVTSNGYGGLGFTSGGSGASPTSSPATATVHAAPANSPEITVVGWIDGTAPDLLNFLAGNMNSGVNSELMSNLDGGGLSCGLQVGFWLFGIPTNIETQADVNWVNLWGIAHSPNSDPGPTINPQVLAKSIYSYRLFNDYGGTAPNANGFQVGNTPDPCKWLSGSVSNWLDAGQSGPYNSAQGTSATGKQYQIAEGRVGRVGQRAYTVVNSGRTIPWIYSVIEFDSSGNPTYSDVSIFPTFSVYQNGTLVGAPHEQTGILTFFDDYDQSNVSGFSPIP